MTSRDVTNQPTTIELFGNERFRVGYMTAKLEIQREMSRRLYAAEPLPTGKERERLTELLAWVADLEPSP